MNQLVIDKLDHESIANTILQAAINTESTSSFALFGAWGRGKSDVLKRIDHNAKSKNEILAITVNPWESGHSDVLSCIATELARNCIGKFEPAELVRLVARITNVGIVFCDRVVARPFINKFGIDVEKTIEAVENEINDPLLKSSITSTPTELATNAIEKLCKRAFGDKKVLILIDELDRCPPSWRTALVESLYFLKKINYPLVLITAVERNSLIRAFSENNDDMGSLSSKVFDAIFELPDTDNPLALWAGSMLCEPDPVLGQSIVEYLASCKNRTPANEVEVSSLCRGICFSVETRTPRCVLRTIARLRSIALSKIDTSSLPLRSRNTLFAFAGSLAMKDRFPDLAGQVFDTLPVALNNFNGRGSNEIEKLYQAIDDVAEHFGTTQKQTVTDLFRPILFTNHDSHKLISITHEFANGLHCAKSFCASAYI